MTTVPIPCGCKECSTPEAEAAYREALAMVERDRAINARAFEMFLADREAGRPTKPNAAYRAAAEAQHDAD